METIVGVIQEVSGHTFDIIYDLYFTEERLIAVLIQHPSEVINPKSSLSFQTILVGNTFSKRKEQDELKRLANERRNLNKTMTPSELAHSHSANFEIRYESIASLEIKVGIFGATLKITFGDLPYKNLTFRLTKNQAQNARQILEQLIPKSKLKWI